jgi:adenosine deaminase
MSNQVNEVLSFLAGTREVSSFERRLRALITELTGRRFSRSQLRKVYKANIHDHIDCFPEYYTLLSLHDQLYGFDFSKIEYPEGIRAYWKAMNFDPSNAQIPAEVVSLFRGEHLAKSLKGTARAVALRKSRREAAKKYGEFLVNYGGGSLFQYVQAIVVNILPVMQNARSIEHIIKQRLANAKRQGERMLELRGAPQLHTWQGMTAEDALKSYIAGIQGAEIPVGLIVCALRHEDPSVAWNLAKLTCKYHRKGVTTFDLAADEASNSGVLRWWIKPAVLVSLFGVNLTIHLWETNEPTDDDIRCLNAFDVILPSVNMRLAEAGLNVKDVLTSKEVEDKVSAIIDKSIAEVLDGIPEELLLDRPVEIVAVGDTVTPVALSLPDGAKVMVLPDIHVPAQHHRIVASVQAFLSSRENPGSPHVAMRLGHGFRGHRQGKRICEVCFSSNVVTKQVKSIAEHPGHEMWELGVAMCIDGTTLIGIAGMLDELVLLQEHGWDAARFLVSSLWAIAASSFSRSRKIEMVRECLASNEALARE